MRADLVAGGLSEWSHIPLTHAAMKLLLALEVYEYTLVAFHPDPKDLWLVEPAKATTSIQIHTSRGSTSTTLNSVVQMASGDFSSGTITAGPGGGSARIVGSGFEINTSPPAEPSGKESRGVDQHTVLFDGSELHSSVREGNDGVVTHRRVHLHKPYRQSKHVEELTAGTIFADAYNATNATHWPLTNTPEDRDADLQLGPHRVQVVKCSEGADWASLARDSAYADSVSEAQAVGEIMATVERKTKKHYSNASALILVVDGGFAAIPCEVVDRLIKRLRDELNTAVFQEVWYVSRSPREAMRLFPEEKRSLRAEKTNYG